MAVCEHRFDTHDALTQALSGRIAKRLQSSIEVDGEATLFVSGGSTPVPLFDALSRETIDWIATTVGLVDERWVDEDHEASNTALVRQHLLANHAAAASYWPMYRGGEPGRAVDALRADFPVPAGRGPTVALLGMGGDLHTASIFPDMPETPLALAADAPSVLHTMPGDAPGNPPHPRVTLSRTPLSRARLLVLLLRGESKLLRYRDALEVPLERATDAPIVAFLADPRVCVEVYWSP